MQPGTSVLKKCYIFTQHVDVQTNIMYLDECSQLSDIYIWSNCQEFKVARQYMWHVFR